MLVTVNERVLRENYIKYLSMVRLSFTSQGKSGVA